LKVPAAGITNAMLADSKITLNASTAGGLTVPGAMTLGDTYTIGLKTCSTNQVLQYSGTAWACASVGTGTVTSVASGSGLTGGPITTSGTLSIATGGVTNTMLKDSTVTVTAGSGLTGGGSVALGSSTSLSVNTAVVPELTTANTFTANQTVNATITATPGSLVNNSIVGNNSSIAGTAVTGNSTATTGGTEGVLGEASSTSGVGVEGYAPATTGFTYGVWGVVESGNGTGVFGEAAGTGTGVTGTSTTGVAVYGNSPSSGTGVYGASTDGTGVIGSGGPTGGDFFGSTYGSFSYSGTDTNFNVGAWGGEYGSTQETFGVYGYSASNFGVGTYGQAVSASNEGSGWGGSAPWGVWGDTGVAYDVRYDGAGVLATADDNYALIAVNNSPSGAAAAYFENDSNANDADPVVLAYGGFWGGECEIDVSGNFTCTGSITPVVPVGGSRKVALNTISSPENWFEDAGSGQLSSGEAVVHIEAVFGETVNTGMEYHVFLTPNGDCKGLYVAQKSPTSFVVRELGGGTSSIAFDYRIMAKRKGYEQLRLVDKTEHMNAALPKRAAGTRPAMPTAQEIRKQQEAHLHTAHLAQPALKAK
jgi:hypothetical protein